jgi:hypothetical protein
MAQEQIAVTTPNQLAANLFNITGPIVINYSASSIAGVMTFSKDAEPISNSAAMKSLVSMPQLRARNSPWRPLSMASSVLNALGPRIRLSMDDQVDFETLGILTTNLTGLVPPTGLLQIYSYTSLEAFT